MNLEEILKRQDEFQYKEYPKLNKKEKINYWLAKTYDGMRTQGEVIADEYSEFSKKWYEHALSVESDFDNIFKEVVANIGFEFNWEEYHKRILE